jgi:hypothetical protein
LRVPIQDAETSPGRPHRLPLAGPFGTCGGRLCGRLCKPHELPEPGRRRSSRGGRHLKRAKLPGSASRVYPPDALLIRQPARTWRKNRRPIASPSLKDAAGRATRSDRGLPGVRHRAEGPPSRRAEARLDRGSKEPIFSLWAPCCFQGKLTFGRSGEAKCAGALAHCLRTSTRSDKRGRGHPDPTGRYPERG